MGQGLKGYQYKRFDIPACRHGGRHWFTYHGQPGTQAPVCQHGCGAPNPYAGPEDRRDWKYSELLKYSNAIRRLESPPMLVLEDLGECPQVGNGGLHSPAFYEGGSCAFCGARRGG